MNRFLFSLLLIVSLAQASLLRAQTTIYGEVRLDNFDYQKSKNHMVRLYGYYRNEDDGYMHIKDRELKFYRIHEGISSVDIRYGEDSDDGSELIVGRNLVHPDRPPQTMSFFELEPYTFLEKARKDTKKFRIEEKGDTTKVYTKQGLVGTAVRDIARHELRIKYKALAPDTVLSANILIASVRLSNIMAEAVYHIDDEDISYVPQGNLKHCVFEGDIVMEVTATSKGNIETFHERTEFYVDSVAYLTKDEYKAQKKLKKAQRREKSGYHAADIERLKAKYSIPQLTAHQKRRIEEQLDWEEELSHMTEADKMQKAIEKGINNKKIVK